jgi:hypothetical protein
MPSSKFATAMHDIRGLVQERDLSYVRSHAAPLSPRDFVPASPDVSASRYGGSPSSSSSSVAVAVAVAGLGILGIVLAICALQKMRKRRL